MKWKAIAVDFDNTLAYLDDPGYQNLFRIFIKRGIATAIQMRKAYEETKKTQGFSLEHLIKTLTDAQQISLGDEREVIEREFEDWLTQNLKVYTDSIPTVYRWKQGGIPVLILTAGAEAYQYQKIRISGIPCDGIITVPRINEKAGAIQKIIEKYGTPILFLDDKASELDALRGRAFSNNQVRTVHIQRPGCSSNEVSRYPHWEVQSLAEVEKRLRKEEVERG